MMPTWYIRNNAQRNDIVANATLAANNSGQVQRVMRLWVEDDPDHALDATLYEGEWWVLESMISPDPSYPGVAGVPT